MKITQNFNDQKFNLVYNLKFYTYHIYNLVFYTYFMGKYCCARITPHILLLSTKHFSLSVLKKLTYGAAIWSYFVVREWSYETAPKDTSSLEFSLPPILFLFLFLFRLTYKCRNHPWHLGLFINVLNFPSIRLS